MLSITQISFYKSLLHYFIPEKKNNHHTLQDIYNKVKKESLLKEVKNKINIICE